MIYPSAYHFECKFTEIRCEHRIVIKIDQLNAFTWNLILFIEIQRIPRYPNIPLRFIVSSVGLHIQTLTRCLPTKVQLSAEKVNSYVCY